MIFTKLGMKFTKKSVFYVNNASFRNAISVNFSTGNITRYEEIQDRKEPLLKPGHTWKGGRAVVKTVMNFKRSVKNSKGKAVPIQA